MLFDRRFSRIAVIQKDKFTTLNSLKKEEYHAKQKTVCRFACRVLAKSF